MFVAQPSPTPPRPLWLAGAAALAVAAVAPIAAAELSATASVATAQSAAPFDYTVTLQNTGDTPIGAFWFAWTDVPSEYDFLPTEPTNISIPTGWAAPVTHNLFPGDGYGIEWYNYTGAPVAPGASRQFHFTSNDSPATLAGDSFFPGFKVTNSVVYIGFPEGDPGYRFVASVPAPAPAGAALFEVFAIAALARRRARAD